MRREGLDHFLIVSEQQLYRVVCAYVSYFKRARPPQGLQQQIPEQIENAKAEMPTTNQSLRFPGLQEKDSERQSETSALDAAHRG